MNWEEVKETYPAQWLIIEAIKAKTENKKRKLEEITVVNKFKNSKDALKKYMELHKEYPSREMYVVNSSRSRLDIEEFLWSGVRIG